jgi:hypothetical protein
MRAKRSAKTSHSERDGRAWSTAEKTRKPRSLGELKAYLGLLRHRTDNPIAGLANVRGEASGPPTERPG